MTSRFNVGASIRRAQKQSRITNRQLAKDFEVSEMTVQRWRKSDDQSVSRTAQLADYFDIDFNSFIELGRSYEPEGSCVAISEAG